MKTKKELQTGAIVLSSDISRRDILKRGARWGLSIMVTPFLPYSTSRVHAATFWGWRIVFRTAIRALDWILRVQGVAAWFNSSSSSPGRPMLVSHNSFDIPVDWAMKGLNGTRQERVLSSISEVKEAQYAKNPSNVYQFDNIEHYAFAYEHLEQQNANATFVYGSNFANVVNLGGPSAVALASVAEQWHIFVEGRADLAQLANTLTLRDLFIPINSNVANPALQNDFYTSFKNKRFDTEAGYVLVSYDFLGANNSGQGAVQVEVYHQSLGKLFDANFFIEGFNDRSNS